MSARVTEPIRCEVVLYPAVVNASDGTFLIELDWELAGVRETLIRERREALALAREAHERWLDRIDSEDVAS